MKPPYVLDRLREAAEAAAIHDGDPRDALYLAHLCLHTVQPEQLPEGELRDRSAPTRTST